ncbi:hypothetical protein QBC35DRAFT_497086 [Podospora australis]|uniref:Transmembrane protein n=1 Tax=Podospora australis TaxID=1536484 RepID=A0AAN6WTY2_9PEZI|nr:hypothetical protein QBC35DRAFT_497086 [Podospora australis]
MSRLVIPSGVDGVHHSLLSCAFFFFFHRRVAFLFLPPLSALFSILPPLSSAKPATGQDADCLRSFIFLFNLGISQMFLFSLSSL